MANPLHDAGWERLLIAYHGRLADEGLAYVHKVPEDLRRKNPCDFLGSLAPLGRAVAFDAKHTRSPGAWALRYLAPHQAKHLEQHEAMGAVSGIALRTPRGCFWLPWERVRRAWDARAPSVDPREVGVPFELAWAEVGDGSLTGAGWLDAAMAVVP